MVTDPIADLLVRLQNASRARKADVSVPFSQMKLAIAEILSREGYVGELDKKKKNTTLTIPLVYKDGRPGISGVKRISKPSRRLYMGVREIHPIKRGKGLIVLTTPAGVLSGKEAKEKRVGGEVLFEIW